MSARYELFKATNSHFYFRLRAGNSQIILQSEGYLQKSGAENGIQSVRENSPFDSRYKRLTSNRNKPYFTLTALNGQVIGVSEEYETTQGRENGILSVKQNGPTAPVVDLT